MFSGKQQDVLSCSDLCGLLICTMACRLIMKILLNVYADVITILIYDVICMQ